MKQAWRIVAVSLLVITLSTRCTPIDGPEAAAKISFLEWAANIRVPYRHETFQSLDNDGTSATVRITVELKLQGEWTEKQVEVHCENVEKGWQCDRSIQFE